MQKLSEFGKTLVSTADICNDLESSNSLACMYALRYCALNHILDDKVLSAIQRLKKSKLIEWNTCKISDCAIVALHLLDVEHYLGNNHQILKMIETKFYTV